MVDDTYSLAEQRYVEAALRLAARVAAVAMVDGSIDGHRVDGELAAYVAAWRVRDMELARVVGDVPPPTPSTPKRLRLVPGGAP